ncbi:beta-mannosidase [Anaeromicropila populeti]|uniref:Beta-mannosidase B n=2 Tax=Anaeromicropila populeti TaxID=37658 RepID=A0A1I6KHU0_9FIRM|nr:sugar-binding domain-containing protein [Anaeromicropila populeti]SFR90766.1 beta-mannosidase [Anaeromicropila populeti]
MKIVNLNGIWQIKIIGENVFDIGGEYMEAEVPGSVYGTLLKLNKIPDPFYRDNELNALKLMENDFEYKTEFMVEEELLEDELILRFDGIDTLADIYLNDEHLGYTNNMHRIWEFSIGESVQTGLNVLTIILHSPTKYIKEENEKIYTGGVQESMEGFPHLRKAHCMFGWDWGPRLPDAGIWRNVSLLSIRTARFDSVYVSQEHFENRVELIFDVICEVFGESLEQVTEITVTSPDGKVFAQNNNDIIVIEQPKLWWPNGYGEQPLYTVKAVLKDMEGEVLDVWEKKIGLRTLTINQDKDEWGNCFAHEVNGIKVFAMGADYIPEDSVLGRCTEERTRKLLKDCIRANYNSIRVWGGGYYPDDYFYEICDEEGLLVWQDFMYACASYELDEEFEENIRQETIENVRRIRHHASLALWCGNNEMETQTLDKVWKPSIKQTCDYIKIFEYIIPQILREEDPNTFYWPSSPSSGGNYDNPWDENRGDAHYWDVWHGNKPFSEFRKFYFRYLSEFGFQSFPDFKTVKAFTEERDRNIFSRVMEMHQRNRAANGKILSYLSDTYLYPQNFELLLYASQLLQADSIRYGIEHNRRNRGRCMGTVVWQLNDIWPVASWSSIDYYGRWKALHYAEKRAFAPIMISCEEVGEMTERPHCIMEPGKIEKSARLNVANETRAEVQGIVKWALRTPDSTVILSGEIAVQVPALSSVWLEKLDFSFINEWETYLSFELMVENTVVSQGTCLFTMPKHFNFLDPKLTCERKGKQIIVCAESFAKGVEIQAVDGDLILSDNFFDMNKGERVIQIEEGEAKEILVRSVYHIR